MLFLLPQNLYRMISSYFQDLSSSIGLLSLSQPSEPPDTRHVTFLELQAVRRPVPLTFIAVGYVDGFDVWRLGEGSPEKIAAKHNSDAIAQMRLIPSQAGHPRNAVVVHKTSPSVVRFIDLSTGESYHLIRMTSSVINIQASLSAISVAVDGRIHIYHPETLQESFSLQSMAGSNACSLHDRWIAYNMNAQQSGLAPISNGALLGQVWNKLSSMGQDAFDNIVLAVSNHPVVAQGSSADGVGTAPTMSALQSPVRVARDSRNGLIAIRDVVSMKVIACIEEKGCNRPIEFLQWSNCGTQLMATSGNGHSVLVYEVALGSQGFKLKCSLNRGVTPAVITGLSLGSNGRFAAIASARGTVHLFDLSEDNTYIGNVKTGGGQEVPPVDTQAIFDHSGSLILVNKFTLSVQRYVAAPEPELKATYAVVRPATGESTDQMLDLSWEAPDSLAVSEISIKTCNDLQVPLWMCPQLSFWRSPQMELINHPVDHRDVRVVFSTPLNKAIYLQELERVLTTPIPMSHQETSLDKYFMSAKDTTREGFVNIVPVGGVNSPR